MTVKEAIALLSLRPPNALLVQSDGKEVKWFEESEQMQFNSREGIWQTNTYTTGDRWREVVSILTELP